MFNAYIPVEVPGGLLRARIVGHRGAPLVLLHGGPGMTQDYFFPDMTTLCSMGYQIFTYDQRGCGYAKEEELDPAFINLETYITDFEAFCARFNLKNFVLVGHSWGGLLALKCAAAYPELVKYLVVINPMPVSLQGYEAFVAECVKRLEPYQEELDIVRRSDQYREGDAEAENLYYSLIFRAYFSDQKKVSALRSVPERNTYMPANWRRVEGMFQQNLISKPFDFHDDLKKIEARTLFMYGQDDPLPREWIDKMRGLVRGSGLSVIQKSGHFPWIEQSSDFFAYLQAFLIEADARRKGSSMVTEAMHTLKRGM